MPDARDPQLDDLRRRARRRLVGAVVLALAAAVLVPMLLESDPKPLGEDVAVRIPPVDDGKFVSKLGDKAKDGAPAPKAEPAKPETPKSDAAKPEAAATPPAAASGAETWKASRDAGAGNAAAPESAKSTAPKPAATTEAPAAAKAPAASPKDIATAKPAEAPASPGPAKEPAPAKAAEPAKPAAAAEATKAATGTATDAKAGGYSVQLAAFIDDKGANALAGRLKKSGYPAYTEPYNTSRGTLWRVRVGPYPSRDAAEAARTRLKGDGQNGIITAAAK